MKFGAHVSTSGGLAKAFANGKAAGCDALQIFSKNQQQWNAKPLTDSEISAFRAAHAASGMNPLVVHDSYLINLASPDDALRAKSMKSSTLEEIDGIGPKRRQALLKAFGSLDGIRQATVDQLAAIPGMTRKTAEELKSLL
jgi:5'-3' exonuclease